MNVVWAYIIIIGIALLIPSLFIIGYPPFIILSIGLIISGSTAYAIDISNNIDDTINVTLDSLYENLELIFRYYNKQHYHRLFVPSSYGCNGVLLIDKYPIKIDKINKELVNKFDDSLGIFLETPGSIIINEMKGKGINFTENLDYLMKKALSELYKFSDNVNINYIRNDLIRVSLINPKPGKNYGILGYVQSLIAAAVLAEKESKLVYVDKQEKHRNTLNIDLVLL
ncbi:hypothetical protein [Acidianus brierleyi]|uniref:Uncharacterized protein n=1 Tax=Acidianus brierleyi TaxID=41673 RepID=A0A2U9ID77_9CREN|nr:hypothetical protein [Acidianus brierleyi]AWR93977.1 hypothetical protein DFR85_04420 [Acidianus brierleyi]